MDLESKRKWNAKNGEVNSASKNMKAKTRGLQSSSFLLLAVITNAG
ncbi:hypothetical protein LACDD01_02062 [Lactococcus sp. DD01]|nr:hypothetical protein LACDD01_02062 [Lactococcus sp. DD01]